MSLLLELPHEPQLLQTDSLGLTSLPPVHWPQQASCLWIWISTIVFSHKVLLSGMDKSEDSAAAAAVAFRHICDGLHV
ncbi:hypothetical protein OIU74_016727 [Salix koriyanagi]|uniref:Uncharacterized protein n=1 Tax=Salix koriyanagi TaxID=2511006 RepID=A0A9Q0PHV4_9ROSI|nr:hypothetical protein OIU74_016727 [Salix koriyanagi]